MRMVSREDRMVVFSLGYMLLICYSTVTIISSHTPSSAQPPEKLERSEMGENFRKKRRFVKMTLDQY